MRDNESSKRTEKPARPHSVQSSHPQARIISDHQNQLQYQGYMAWVKQEKPFLPHYFSINSVDKTQASQNCTYFFKQIGGKWLHYFVLVGCVISPSVGEVGEEQNKEGADCEMVEERYFLIALLSPKMFMYRVDYSFNKVLMKQLLKSCHNPIYSLLKQIQFIINSTNKQQSPAHSYNPQQPRSNSKQLPKVIQIKQISFAHLFRLLIAHLVQVLLFVLLEVYIEVTHHTIYLYISVDLLLNSTQISFVWIRTSRVKGICERHRLKYAIDCTLMDYLAYIIPKILKSKHKNFIYLKATTFYLPSRSHAFSFKYSFTISKLKAVNIFRQTKPIIHSTPIHKI